ncbi:hypothetical protein NXS19_008167 [Fusarium pseudograminearum]|nr:hypothetical protein NXS19_008167 [Fusarium pseudograminearum]
MPTNPNSPPGSPPPPADHSLHINSLTSGHVTGSNDPLERHNEWSHNAIANNNATNVNVPFHRKESDTWNAEKPDLYAQHQVAPSIPITAQSTSDHDYRGIIDDLTVEIQQLKNELKRYKKPGPAQLYKDELFEIRVHGLSRKKRESSMLYWEILQLVLTGLQRVHHRKKEQGYRRITAITHTPNLEFSVNVLLPLEVPTSGQLTPLMPPCRLVGSLQGSLSATPS